MSLTALLRAGVPPDHAQTQIDLLMDAELTGRTSHGLLRLPRIVERIANGVLDPLAMGQQTWRGEAWLEVDGGAGLGPVVATAALDALGERTATTGIAIAAIHNNNHIGALSWYCERIARNKGLIAIALTTSEALVHPWGGRRAMLGTNPIAIGVPTGGEPFVLDMATSTVSMGKIHDHAHRKEPIPGDWALDAEGDPTIDPEAAKQGAIAPFGGPKGYALGLSFEILVAALTGAALGTEVQGTLDSDRLCNKGDVFILIRPAAGGMAETISTYLDAIRACDPATPGQPVLVPGDRARAVRHRTQITGLQVAENVWAQIRALAGDPPKTSAARR